MARLANKTNTSKATDIVKSDYWLNDLDTPFGKVNQNLVTGLKGQTGVTMSKIIKGIESKGIDYVNEYFKAKGFSCYVVQEGTSSSSTDLPDDF